MNSIRVGIIGGSGLYDLPGIKVLEELEIKTPYGDPSAPYKIIEVNGIKAAFLARHGQGHRYTPSEIPVRANLCGFKELGVDRIIAISAVGSLREEIPPEDFVLPDQIIDRTKNRPSSFFEKGIVCHIGFAEPFCERLKNAIAVPLEKEMGAQLHKKGTYVCMEGPAFSTRAESELYRSWDASVIGMTAIPEAKLAREAEICYALVAMSTDYDCWKIEEKSVTVEMVIEHMKKNTNRIKKTIPEIIKAAVSYDICEHHTGLKGAIISDVKTASQETKNRLKPIAGKYIDI